MTGSYDQRDAFTRGYIEALFFTKNVRRSWEARVSAGGFGYSDLAPEALAMIIGDCQKFQASTAFKAIRNGPGFDALLDYPIAGRDFWFTRNGHECGFGDGDRPEPYATALTATAKAFGEVAVYIGEDGKVWL
jgi:hypothetical protein